MSDICTFEGCDRPVHSGGLCRGHYMQRYRGRELSPLGSTPKGRPGKIATLVPRAVGRLDLELVERLAEAHESGLSLDRSAEACEVHPRTFRRWRERGKAEEGEGTIHAFLVRRMLKAGALFELTHLRKIASGENRWQSSAWLLERTRQDRYALIQRVETGAPGSFEKMTDDELEAEIVRLTRKSA